MDPYRTLEEEHETFLKQIDRLLGLRDAATRKEALNALTLELVAHMRAEEQAIYLEMKEAGPGIRHLAMQLYEGHHACILLLQELGDTHMDSEIWTAKMEVFRSTLGTHIHLEEDVAFTVLSDHYPSDKLRRMMQDYELTSKNLLLPPSY